MIIDFYFKGYSIMQISLNYAYTDSYIRKIKQNGLFKILK